MRYAHYCFYLAVLFLSLTAVASGSETVTFPSQDGLLITADIYAPYKNGEAPIIVLFHQAGWSRGEYTEIAPWLNTLGYNCMAVDQRSGKYARGVKNETALRAKKENRPTGYVDALPDIKAALIYARKHYGKDGVIAWGSSYSAALVLKVAGDSPALVDGVLAFSPGEYFERAGKTATWVQDSAQRIKVPVFITSAHSETDRWAGIFAAIKSGRKVSFIPATDGRHGSRALWREYPDSGAYQNAAKAFLEQYFPTRNAARQQ
ncbi:MAG TPA: alpha/beta hydrolase [Gammaproteobacteria bacterium]|nr:alpha/beta hydrolase [Gammaproteobacteria bacterium]